MEVTTPAVSSAAMGRAHLPGMWRLLDRAANDLDHVRWAEVTERGYCTIELTPDAATATWWFVHPYDDDPSARAPSPPWPSGPTEPTGRRALTRVEPATNDPERPGLLAPAPPRPDDLPRLRRRRRARVAAEVSAMAAALLAPVSRDRVAEPAAEPSTVRPCRRRRSTTAPRRYGPPHRRPRPLIALVGRHRGNRADPTRSERPSQLGDQGLERVGAARRHVVTPKLIGQPLRLHRLPGADQQEQEKPSLHRTPDGQIHVTCR